MLISEDIQVYLGEGRICWANKKSSRAVYLAGNAILELYKLDIDTYIQRKHGALASRLTRYGKGKGVGTFLSDNEFISISYFIKIG